MTTKAQVAPRKNLLAITCQETQSRDCFRDDLQNVTQSIQELTSMLEIQIAGNYSKCGTSEPIIPEIVVAIGLQWLAGGSYI